MAATVSWWRTVCPRCGNTVLYPTHTPTSPQPAVVVCAQCDHDINVAALTTRPVLYDGVLSAQIQARFLIDETPPPQPPRLPEYLIHRHQLHPELGSILRRFNWILAPTEALFGPVAARLLLGMSEVTPVVIGNLRVFASARWPSLTPLCVPPLGGLVIVPTFLTLLLPALLFLSESLASPVSSEHAHLFGITRLITVAACLLALAFSVMIAVREPGYLTRPSPQEAASFTQLTPARLAECGRCPVCFAAQSPFPAVHCFICDVCVMEFDHHCKVLGWCIGRRNRGVFYLYLMSIYVASVCGFLWLLRVADLWCVEDSVETRSLTQHHPSVLWTLGRIGCILTALGVILVAFLGSGIMLVASVVRLLFKSRPEERNPPHPSVHQQRTTTTTLGSSSRKQRILAVFQGLKEPSAVSSVFSH